MYLGPSDRAVDRLYTNVLYNMSHLVCCMVADLSGVMSDVQAKSSATMNAPIILELKVLFMNQ